jgi:hypothetical protein
LRVIVSRGVIRLPVIIPVIIIVWIPGGGTNGAVAIVAAVPTAAPAMQNGQLSGKGVQAG